MKQKAFFKVIFKNLWFIIFIPILTASAAFCVCEFVLGPVYESTESFIINRNDNFQTPGSSYDSIMVDQQMLRDYRELIKSNFITSAVMDRLKIKNIKREDISRKVTVELINETRILAIRVRDSDPVMAKRLAETYGEVFIEQAKSWMKLEGISIIDRAEVPSGPIGPETVLYTLVAGVLGLLAAAGLIFFIEYMDDSVRTLEDIELYMGTVILGTIPEFNIK